MLYSYKFVGERKSVIDHDAFLFYKDKTKVRNKKVINETRHYAKILSSIYKKISESTIEYEAGIYAPGMFYIVPHAYPKKAFVKITDGSKLKGTMNLHTDSKIHSIFFVNLFNKKKYKMWDMGGGFYKPLRQKFSEFLKEFSPRYIFSLHSISKMNRKYIKK